MLKVGAGDNENIAFRCRYAAILPEFGMGPEIDLILLGEAARSLDQVVEIITYG